MAERLPCGRKQVGSGKGRRAEVCNNRNERNERDERDEMVKEAKEAKEVKEVKKWDG